MDAEEATKLNEKRRLAAHSELDLLFFVACEPSFRGTIGVEVSAKDGQIAVPKTTLVRFGAGD